MKNWWDRVEHSNGTFHKMWGILPAHELLASQEACCSMPFNTCGSKDICL
jgi:hypothetical protein